MNKTATINFKTDPKLKKAAQDLAKEFGMSLTALINTILRDVVRTKKVILKSGPKRS